MYFSSLQQQYCQGQAEILFSQDLCETSIKDDLTVTSEELMSKTLAEISEKSDAPEAKVQQFEDELDKATSTYLCLAGNGWQWGNGTIINK